MIIIIYINTWIDFRTKERVERKERKERERERERKREEERETERERITLWLIPVILATWEVKIRRITVQGQPGQKVQTTLSQPIISWTWWCSCHTIYIRSINGRIAIQAFEKYNIILFYC
jgi:hypothetical protein